MLNSEVGSLERYPILHQYVLVGSLHMNIGHIICFGYKFVHLLESMSQDVKRNIMMAVILKIHPRLEL